MQRPAILSLTERLDTHPALTGRGVCIGFIDVGFFHHPDLLRPLGRIRASADVTRDRPEPADFRVPQASAWHGTMTACAAAGSGYVSGGRYRGLASEADLVLIKAGVNGRVEGRHVAAAIRFALRHPEMKIQVLSISLGVEPDDPHAADVLKAVAEVTRRGVTVVVAAGNDPDGVLGPPATSPDAITVGGQDR